MAKDMNAFDGVALKAAFGFLIRSARAEAASEKVSITTGYEAELVGIEKKVNAEAASFKADVGQDLPHRHHLTSLAQRMAKAKNEYDYHVEQLDARLDEEVRGLELLHHAVYEALATEPNENGGIEQIKIKVWCLAKRA